MPHRLLKKRTFLLSVFIVPEEQIKIATKGEKKHNSKLF